MQLRNEVVKIVGAARVSLHIECMMQSTVLLLSSVFLPTAPAPSATPTKTTATASAPSSSPSKSTPRSTTPEMLLLVSIRSCHRIRFRFHWHRCWAQSRLVSSRNVDHRNCSSDGKCGDLHHLESRVYLCSSKQVVWWWCVRDSSPLTSFAIQKVRLLRLFVLKFTRTLLAIALWNDWSERQSNEFVSTNTNTTDGFTWITTSVRIISNSMYLTIQHVYRFCSQQWR